MVDFAETGVFPQTATRHAHVLLLTRVTETTLCAMQGFWFALATPAIVTVEPMGTLLVVRALVTLGPCVQTAIIRLVRMHTLALVTGKTFATLLRLCALHAIGPCARAAFKVVDLILCTLVHDTIASGASNRMLTSATQRASTRAVIVSGKGTDTAVANARVLCTLRVVRTYGTEGLLRGFALVVRVLFGDATVVDTLAGSALGVILATGAQLEEILTGLDRGCQGGVFGGGPSGGIGRRQRGEEEEEKQGEKERGCHGIHGERRW